MSENFYDKHIDDALSKEELDELRPSNEELFQNTYRSTIWYNEAIWTTASMFVESAKEDDEFHEAFMSESSEWRDLFGKDLPQLSAFQGKNAEQVARQYIERNL